MNIDINGFGEKLSSYTKKSHENKPLETIKSELNTIFKENGINDSNFSIVGLAINNDSIELSSSTSNYINKLSQKIFDKEEKEKAKKEGRDPNNKQSQENNKPKSKPIFNFNLATLGKADPKEIENYFKTSLKAAGYAEEDFNKPNPNLKILDFEDKNMDLNINPDKSILEQLTESVKKMFMVMINGEKIEDARKSTEYLHTKEAETSINLDLPGTENDFQKNNINTDTPNVEVNMSTDGNLDIDNELDNNLTEEDKYEIEQFGIDGINTHEEMEDFRQTEEYQQLQQSMTNTLSKHDNNEN